MPNGNQLMASYDTQGRLVQVSHSSGDRFLFEYSADGRLVKLFDHADRVTQYTYNASEEHLLSVRGPDGESTEYRYVTGAGGLLDHHLRSILRPDGLLVEFSYDDLGRLTGQQVAGGEQAVSHAYSGAGKTVVSDALGNTSTYWLDSHGQIAMVEDSLGKRFHITYDNVGNLTGVLGPAALSAQFSYDANGNVVALRDSMAQETIFAYSGPYNNLSLVRDARGNALRYEYDGQGNLTRINYGDNSHENFQYDAGGNLLAWTNRRGATTTYTVNDRGQLIGKNSPDSHDIVDFVYTYDPAGRLTLAKGPEGTTKFTYDLQTDLVIQIEYPPIGDKAIHLTFEYDAAGRRTRSTDQDGREVNYFYDAAGRLERMTDETGMAVADYAYDAAGRLVRETLGNGVYTTYDYDAAWELISLVNHQPDGTVLSRFDYTYDAERRRVAMDTHYGRWTYQYDNSGQLTRAVLLSTASDIPDQDLIYVYDAMGNRIRTVINGEVTEYTTNKLNQYVQVGDESYVFDADGNLIEKTGPDGTTSYTYNQDNRLVAVSRGGDVRHYTYDALGNRIIVEENGAVTRYIVDPIDFGNVVAEYDGSSDVVARYTHGIGLISRAATTDGMGWYSFDGIGSTHGITDAAGFLVNEYAYDPFGNLIAEGTLVPNPFDFVGRFGVSQEASNHHLMRERSYDSHTGRFLSTDPLGIGSGSINLYTYAHNDPISWIDPDGRAPVIVLAPWAWGAVKVGAGKLAVGASKAWGAVNNAALSGAVRATTVRIGSVNIGRAFDFLLRNPKPTISGGMMLAKKLGLDLGSTPPSGPTSMSEVYVQMTDWIIDYLAWYRREIRNRPLPAYPAPAPGPPIGTQQDRSSIGVRASVTPEDKFGPVGYDDPGVLPGMEQRFIQPGQMMHYRIDFWNEEDAEVPTQDAVIVDWLDPAVFDVSTFEFTRIGFLDWDMFLPGGQTIDVRIDARPQMNIAVEVQAGWEMNVPSPGGGMVLDDPTGKLVWWFHTIDPETGDYPADPMAGFLPPFNPVTEYELGWVEFRVKAWDDLPSGTRIENQAFVQFDFLPNPKTNEEWGPAPPGGPWVNTIDAGPPSSTVQPLPPVVNTPEFLVNWHGQDDVGGSEIAHYDIYVSTDNGPFTRWLAATQETSATFAGEGGHSYGFYSVATDNVGHREPVTTLADTTTRVFEGNLPPSIASLTVSRAVVPRDAMLTITAKQVTDPDGTVVLVEFYRDSSDNGLWDDTDERLAAAEAEDDHWTVEVSTAGWGLGDHTLFARAQDNDGGWSDPVRTSVSITQPRSPIADAGGSYTGFEGSPIELDAGNSFHPDGAVVRYRWDLNDDGIWDTDWLDSPEYLYTWNDNWDGKIRLEVSDGTSRDTATAEVMIRNVAPTAVFSAGDPVTYGQPVTIAFTQASDPSVIDTEAGFRYAFAREVADLHSVTYTDASGEDATWTLSGLSAGEHTIYGRIIDKDDGFTEYTTLVRVNKAPLTVSADDQSKLFGAADPVLTYTVDGTLFYGDTVDVVSGVELRSVTGPDATRGRHPIIASGGRADNYAITHRDGVLMVLPTSEGFGNVRAIVRSRTLWITGDNASNTIEITTGDSPGQWIVSGIGSTTVNGQARFVVSGVTRDVVIRMRGGDDVVSMASMHVPRDLRVDAGNGNNTIDLTDVQVRRHGVLRNGRGQINEWFIANSEVRGGVTLLGGRGADRFDFSDTRIGTAGRGRDLRAVLGGGDDLLVFAGGSVGRSISISTNSRSGQNPGVWIGHEGEIIDDELLTTIARDVRIRGGSGNESIRINATSIGRGLQVRSGRGDDVVDLFGNSIGRNASVMLGRGLNQAWIDEVAVSNRFTIRGSRGSDSVQIGTRGESGLDATSASLKTRAGNDLIVLRNSDLERLRAKMGSGSDNLFMEENRITKRVRLDGGRGHNRITSNLASMGNDLATSLSVARFLSELQEWEQA